jgi:hypothetical protein
MNKILADQLNPVEVMAKLDEILHEVNPNAPKTTYTFNGFKRVTSPGRVSGGDDGGAAALKEIIGRQDAGDWVGMIRLSEIQMKDRSEWLTPYVTAGIAYMNIGQLVKALYLLEYAEKTIAGNPDYAPIMDSLNGALAKLRRR